MMGTKKVNDAIIDFVQDGVFKAAEAYSTIKLCENSFKEIILEVMHEFKDWGDFEPDLKDYDFRLAPRPGLGGWMAVIIRGRKKSDQSVRELELSYSSSPKLYVAWRNEPKFFTYDWNIKEFECEKTWSSVLGFKPEIGKDFDIKERYTTLLKELLRFV